MNSTHVLGIVAAAIIVLTLFEMLRRQRLREKHAVIWTVLAVGALVVAVFPGTIVWLSELLHIQVPSNLVFFLGSLLLLAMSLQHSYEIGRLEEQTRTLAEEVALHRLELERWQGQLRDTDLRAGDRETDHQEPRG